MATSQHEAIAYDSPVNWWAATMTGAGLLLLAAACSDDDPTSQATLPAIQTTPTIQTTSTILPSTTLPRFYEVQSGDTLTKIAATYGLPIPAIMETNGITNPDAIFAGQILELPLASEIVTTTLPPVTTVPGPTALPAITTVAP